MRTSSLLLYFVLLVLTPYARSGCGNNTVGGPYANEDTAQRVFEYIPSNPVDTSTYRTDELTVVQYNIQSGATLQCNPGITQQVADINSFKPHFYAIQEVDTGVVSRCNCDMPNIFANGTGMHTLFYRTIFYETNNGMYGHANGVIYESLGIESKLFDNWTNERRAIIAQVTQPPQFNGRYVILVSNHYQYTSETVREGQANETIAFVEGLLSKYGANSLIIMPGDYYTEVGQTGYEILLSYFNNSWNDYHGAQTGGETFPSDSPSNRFDHVWYKVPSDLQMYVKNVQVPDIEDSDHRPVVVTFGFPAIPNTQSSSASSIATAALLTATAALLSALFL